MREKEEIMRSVARQNVTEENPEQYQTRILKTALEVMVDIRDLLSARLATDELEKRP